MTQDEIIEMAKQASKEWMKELPTPWETANQVPKRFLEIFAKLVALRYEKKISDLENIICQRYWDVLQEREACAKTVETIKAYRELEKVCFKFAAQTIRARGQQ